jgi:hypothetical protein
MHRLGRSSQIFSVTFAFLTIVLQCLQVCLPVAVRLLRGKTRYRWLHRIPVD